MKILVANVGSTSFKFKLYEMPAEQILAQGRIESIGSVDSPYQFEVGGSKVSGSERFPDYKDAISMTIKFLTEGENAVLSSLASLSAVGFKTVHGKGMRECRYLDEQTLVAMEAYNFLAPAHNPPYINAIRIFASLIPQTPLVGLFEPAFHRNIPDYAYTYGIPYELAEKHEIRKYGFHGASHRYIAERAPALLALDPRSARIISCHLGGSSSICAIKNGQSVDTSMGFSPQSGILNAKRCGDLDPFIALYLQKVEGFSTDQVADLLHAKSGLLGIAGTSGDMKQIVQAAEQGDDRARLAIDAFCYGVKHYIGAYFVTLEGLDALIFTGGIGERGALVRRKICQGLECLGVQLDGGANELADGEQVISSPESKVTVAVIPTNEELIVAREVKELLDRG